MPLEQLKEMSKRDVVSVLRNVHNLCCYCGNSTDEFCLRLEGMRLNIAFRWLQTDSLEMKVTGMKEYNDFIDSTTRKHDTMINNKSPPTSRTYSQVRGAMQIFFIDYDSVLQHLTTKNVLQYVLIPDVEKEVIAESYGIMRFLAQNGCLVKQHIDLLWKNLTKDDKSFNVCGSFFFNSSLHILFVFGVCGSFFLVICLHFALFLQEHDLWDML